MERIREVMAFNPRISVREIRQRLQDDHRDSITLTKEYILTLRNKINAERKFKMDTTKVTERIGQMQDTSAAVINEMVEMLLSPSVDPKDRINAGKVILAADKALFDAEMDAGVYERQLGSMTFKHKLLIEPERKAAIISALQNIGLIKPTPINQLPTIDVQTTVAPATTGDTTEDAGRGN